MGLNWSEGLRAAGAGLNTLANYKLRKNEQIYQQVRDANLMRFNQEKFAHQREQDRLAGEHRDRMFEETSELKKLQQESLDEQRKWNQTYQEGLLSQGEQRIILQETSQDQAAARHLDTQRNQAMEAYSDRINNAHRLIQNTQKAFNEIKGQAYKPEDQEYKTAEEAYNSAVSEYERLVELQSHAGNKVGLEKEDLYAYQKAQNMGLKAETIKQYLMLPKEQRKQVDEFLSESRKKGIPLDEMAQGAISELLQAVPESTSSTPAPTQPQESTPESRQEKWPPAGAVQTNVTTKKPAAPEWLGKVNLKGVTVPVSDEHRSKAITGKTPLNERRELQKELITKDKKFNKAVEDIAKYYYVKETGRGWTEEVQEEGFLYGKKKPFEELRKPYLERARMELLEYLEQETKNQFILAQGEGAAGMMGGQAQYGE